MRKKKRIAYDFYADSIASFLKFQQSDGDYSKEMYEERRNMARFINNILKKALTKRQQYCFWHFYAKSQSLRQIANDLKIDESTVSRHISAAREKIRCNMEYFYGTELNYFSR